MKYLLTWLMVAVLVPNLATLQAHSLVVHVSPDGSDANDGSETRPVLTLERVHRVIAERQPNENVEVRFAAGFYRSQTVVWTYTMPNHRIRFVGDRSIFDGERKGLSFFRLHGASGQPTNLSFEGLTITRYVVAIAFVGERGNVDGHNGRNSIINNQFLDVGGTGYDPMGYSTAVVALVNSRDNIVRGNIFRGMIGIRCEHLHAIYLAHGSSRNILESNHFEDGCGDAVRIRDRSNDNIVRNNIFTKVGDRGAVSEWFCSRSSCKRLECPSYGNVVENNNLKGLYSSPDMPEVYRHNRPIPPTCSEQ